MKKPVIRIAVTTVAGRERDVTKVPLRVRHCSLPARLASVAAMILVCLGAHSRTAAQTERCWNILPEASALTVHVRPAGLFSGALHEHHFVPREWSGRVCFDPMKPRTIDLELAFRADSLEDRQHELSREDIQTVERQVRSEQVLDASRYPMIRYVADRVTAAESDSQRLRGTLQGELSLHGRARPVEVPVNVRWSDDRLRATGTVEFRQSDFGIEPYSRFFGAVSIEDRVSVEFALDANAQ
jgi:polyisoprenoid-binding protein YceI